MVNILERTDPPMMGSGWTIKLTVMELICGKMGANIGVSGHKMTCRDTASTSILMEYVTTVNTWLTKKKGTECTIGLTDAVTKDGGTRASNTDWAHTLIAPRVVLNTVCGKTESALNGLTSKLVCKLIRVALTSLRTSLSPRVQTP